LYQSANTRDTLGVISESNAVSGSYANLANALSNEKEIANKVAKASQLGNGLVINLRDIKADSKLANLSPEAAAAAGLIIVDPMGNMVVSSAQQGYQQYPPQQGYQQYPPQQGYQQYPPQQQAFATQQAPQQPQQMANQQQMLMMMMQQLQQMQAQFNQSAPSASPNNFSQSSSQTDAWNLASSDPFDFSTISDSPDDGTVDFWGNAASSKVSKSSSSNPFFNIEASTPSSKHITQNNSSTSNNDNLQTQMQQMMQMMMMMQGGQGNTQQPQQYQQYAPQQGYQQAPQAQLTLGTLKTMTMRANTVVNVPPQGQGMSATTKMAMQMAQENGASGGSDDNSFSF
jgi:hypothetical protein